jgi:hypothetical protein
MAEIGVHPHVHCASACGIPASTLLSVLDYDRAYICSDACTRVPCTLRQFWGMKHSLSRRRACVFSRKVNYLLVRGPLYTFSMAE